MKKRQSRWLTKAIAISIILHLFIFFGSALLITFELSPFTTSEALPQPQAKSPPPIVFELVETPESARIDQPKDAPKFFSDKTARAQNETSPEDLQIDDPFSAGVIPTPQMPEQPKSAQKTVEASVPKTASQAENVLQVPLKKNTFSRDFLAPKSFQRPEETTGEGELKRPKNKKFDSRAPDLGSFSLNTYAWEFAPYMLRLKRKIEKNIFPPPAFTYMGMISGTTYLKFRITPEGTLEGLEVLDYNGHKSLMETSWRAVEVSVPFDPLPKDFPEKYLEITARFEYFVMRKR